ncbi:M42 family metallopeptidase [Halalkalibacter sp. APA_J-10(15)]|uniref:M42 family metallopeptidase n=1 Tax=Halalkalibacter sp. APA_J-10(15) TaxID=2933805 RepID=UPI001FF12121|nr:M42 family metallopeptidase [Halalkalibacter sp. APA_J-10(15)]MCK0472882.1 M42 family metallopeptidase [Halalkalibacter sp. APA_J-10(15)]
MEQTNLQLMKTLTETEGLPGFEERIFHVMKTEIASHTSQIESDHLGSIVGRIGEGRSKILLAGHLDEVGFIVSGITKNGFLRFRPLGGWWGHVLLSQRVKVLSKQKDITGVIGSKAPHVLTSEERKKVLTLDKMFIDIGASSREEVESYGVAIGDPIATICPFESLSNEKMLLSRTWDNRAGCYIALKVLERLKQEKLPNTLYSGATVQEEVGLRGAETLANMIQPQIAFATDVGVAGDIPGMNKEETSLELGKGPVLCFMDRSMIPHRKLRDFVVNIAKEHSIPYQIDIMTGGGTDAGKFHLNHHGVPTLVVSVASRYIHSHVSIVHYDDLEHAVTLLCEVIKQLDDKTIQSIIGLS